MMDVEYISIAEFAERAGVSKQAIYKQANNSNSKIAPYIQRNGKQILIKVSALRELYEVEQPYSTNSTPKAERKVDYSTQQSTKINQESQPINPNSTLNSQPISTDYIEFLKAQVSELKAEKAEVEQRLNATIQEKDNIIKEQSAQLAELAQQVAQIANKALIATSQQQYLTAMEKGDKCESEKIETIPVDEQQMDKPKGGFWSRLFSK